jgi:hypothetical protein
VFSGSSLLARISAFPEDIKHVECEANGGQLAIKSQIILELTNDKELIIQLLKRA